MVPDRKDPLPDEPTPSDAPPSYEDVAGASTTAPRAPPRDVKYAPTPGPSSPHRQSIPSSSSSRPTLSGFGNAPSSSFAGTLTSGFSSWWPSGPSREVKSTVAALIRDLVRPASNASPAAVLDSCADACRSYSIPLSSLLQENSIESHTPLYWAIVNHQASLPPNEDALLNALFSHARPLGSTACADVRHACLITSDQVLFHHLQPFLNPPSAADDMILAGGQPDTIVLTAAPGESAFAVDVQIPLFQKRMHMGRRIPLEFIARGRLWLLEFCTATYDDMGQRVRRGQWCAKLRIAPHSAPTYVDSQLVVEAQGMQPVSMRMKSYMELMPSQSIMAAIDEALQHEGSPYIRADDVLRARLEARLAKPEGECIIC